MIAMEKPRKKGCGTGEATCNVRLPVYPTIHMGNLRFAHATHDEMIVSVE